MIGRNITLYNSKHAMNYNPAYMDLFGFEKFEAYEEWRQWIFDNWSWSVYLSFIYLIVVFSTQKVMQRFEAFNLRTEMALWSFGLAIFSIFGFLRMAPELQVSVTSQPDGWHRSVCTLENHNSATSLWGLLFTMSKVVEFGDTIFVVLRKQRLQCLHWYHHVTVCVYCWFAHGAHDPASRWFATINYLIHAIMYTYYGLKAMQIKAVSRIAFPITCLQLTQMVIGFVINLYSLHVITNGNQCDRPLSNIYLALVMYGSYFVLFANFLIKTYFRKSAKKSTIKKGQ